MKLSLNAARLGGAGRLPLTEFADLASRHGFDGIDFGIGGAVRAAAEQDSIPGEQTGASGLRAYLNELDVAPAVFGLDVEWRRDDEAFAAGMAALPAQAVFAQGLGTTRCCTWMPSATNDDPAVWMKRTADRFRRIAEVFADHGIRLGLEWVGPHHLRAGGANAMGANPTVFTLDGTLALIDDIGASNVGLLVDCYHCFTTGIGEAEVAKLTDAQIVHVHINDAPKGTTPETALDGGRVLPGDGVIDLAGFLRGLQTAGYRGYIATEVLAGEEIAPTPDEAAARVRAALQRVGL